MDDDRVPAYYTDAFMLPLPAGHRFPMPKYRRTRARLAAGPWAHRLQFRTPPAATDDELSAAHDPAYAARVVEGRLQARDLARLGLPWSAELVERARRSAGATLAASRRALASGLGIALAGGTHHARRDAGHGYCVFNDAAVAIRVLQAEGALTRAAVLDLDVHQGNGTALIFSGRPEVLTISVNEAPAAGRYAHRSDVDIDLPHGTADAAYLEAVDAALAELDGPVRPELVIYNAGADPFQGDLLGQLCVSASGLGERDRRVFAWCRTRRMPVVVTLGGGYLHDVDLLAGLHALTVETALCLAETDA
ncbi:MAG: histone deacetylase [Candidatus Latescibacterota bacterium]